MKWKVVIVEPRETVYENTFAFDLFYPVPPKVEVDARPTVHSVIAPSCAYDFAWGRRKSHGVKE